MQNYLLFLVLDEHVISVRFQTMTADSQVDVEKKTYYYYDICYYEALIHLFTHFFYSLYFKYLKTHRKNDCAV